MEPRKHTVTLVSINKQNYFWLEIADTQFEEDNRLSRKRRDAGKGKALCNSIRTLRLRRVWKHGELLVYARLAHWNG